MEGFAEENNIVNKIRELCYVNGREKKPKQSAKLLHQLGQVYAKKKDKIPLIQSAALFNAAIVRQPENINAIQNDLKKLCKRVLTEAKCKTTAVCLVEIAVTIKDKLKAMREEVNDDISNIEPISDWAVWEDDESVFPFEEKVVVVMNLQAKVTNNYKQIMSDLAHTVEEILGDSPCQYALIGMGSLAREEITPYSDFECILVLEEGVQNHKNYDIVLEYFRWFAVVFQLILINLGETLIPSVAISTLNDFSSKNGDWFYDAFTPSGVSFDGMMPHACKSPLGRQETEIRPWKTELIKPVSEMVKYLESEEDLKNGYHLAELLSKICFVSGNKSVYDNFDWAIAEQIQENRKSDQYFESIKQTVMEDQQKFDMTVNMSKVFSQGQIDVKKIMYRSVTIFVSALGRIYGMQSSSCFNIIQELKEKQIISEEEKLKLQFAVAVACEIRLKVYMKQKKQGDKNDPTVADYAGLKSAVDACVIADYLQKHVLRLCEMKNSLGVARAIFPVFEETRQNKDNILKLTILYCLHYYEECLNLGVQCIEATSLNDIRYSLDSYNLLLHSYTTCVISLYELQQPLECLAMLEDIKPFFSSDVSTQLLDFEQFDLFSGMLSYERELEKFVSYYSGLVYFDLKMYDNAYQCLSRETGLRSTDDKSLSSFYLTSGFHKALCLMKMKRLDEAIQLLEEACIFSKENMGEICTLHHGWIKNRSTIHLGRCFYKLCRYDEAMTTFQQALDFYKSASQDEESDLDVALTYHLLGKCHYKTNRNHKAIEYFNAVAEVLKLKQSTPKTLKLAKKNRYFCARTLFKLKRYREAKEYFLLECDI